MATVGCESRESPSAKASPSEPPSSEKVAVVAPALNANPKTPDFAIEAANSIRIQSNGKITGGDVGARGNGSGPFLSNGVALDIGSNAIIDTARNSIADSIQLGINASTGDVQTNRFADASGTHHGSITALVPLPALPIPSAVSPGTSNVTVANNATTSISPGRFATVSVGKTATLRL